MAMNGWGPPEPAWWLNLQAHPDATARCGAGARAGPDGPGAPDVATLTRLVAERLTAVPRLRQRLVPAPWGCGGPIWVDDPHVDVRLVSHVRGPEEPVHLAGRRVRAAVPVALSESGNITEYFEVLSYAGAVTVTAIVDPDHVPDLDVLLAGLREELDVLVGLDP